jgi:hypothetical protein
MKILETIKGWFSWRGVAKPSGLNDMKTQPLDAEALARALQGEGRRHVSYGEAWVAAHEPQAAVEAGYVLVGNSDGLNVLPDFALFGLARAPLKPAGARLAAQRALGAFMRGIMSSAVVHLLDVDGVEGLPLTEAVSAGFQAITGLRGQLEGLEDVQITAGMLFADLLILGHVGPSHAYLLSRREVLRLGASGDEMVKAQQQAAGQEEGSRPPSVETPWHPHILTRPAPRDGYLLLSGPSLWSYMAHEETLRTVYEHGEAQAACEVVAQMLRDQRPPGETALVLMRFPPDFDSWR